MIFRSIKKKISQNYINKLLANQQRQITTTKINHIGFICNVSEYDDLQSFKQLSEHLECHYDDKAIKVFTDKKDDDALISESYFNVKSFQWNGRVNNTTLTEFANTEFDILISYYKGNQIELDVLTALSKAKFKVGLSTEDHRLYDLIIDIDPKAFQLFTTELKKYLTQLNKL